MAAQHFPYVKNNGEIQIHLLHAAGAEIVEKFNFNVCVCTSFIIFCHIETLVFHIERMASTFDDPKHLVNGSTISFSV